MPPHLVVAADPFLVTAREARRPAHSRVDRRKKVWLRASPACHVAPDSGRTGRVADLPRDDADAERGHRPEQALKPPTHEVASVLEMLRVTSGIAPTHEDSASPAEFTLVMVTVRAGRYGESPGYPTGASPVCRAR